MNFDLDYNYDLGGTVPLYSTNYIKRTADQQLYEALIQKHFCYILNSRQMGKSSLRVRTSKALNSQRIDCATIDLQGIGSHNITAQEWYAGISETIVNELSLEFDIDSWLQHRQHYSPIQNFRTFIHEVLLPNIVDSVVIFIDEIDSVLQLDFKNDFFGLIRFFYNQRADQPQYQKISFVLLGVASPADLIGGENQLIDGLSPFNIGKAIELQGFQPNEVQPLENGLIDRVDRPSVVLAEILSWTGGQPFLTQRLCQLVRDNQNRIVSNTEKNRIQQIVQSKIIDHWESQDDQLHLRTIRDRLKAKKHLTIATLSIYQQILNGEEVLVDRSPEKMELILSGIVALQDGRLRVRNPIYQAIFNLEWAEKILASDRSYAPALAKWIASDYQDQSCLLRSDDLREVMKWAENKNIGSQDFQFLQASQDLEFRKSEQDLEKSKQERQNIAQDLDKAEQRLSNVERKTKHQIRWGTVILSLFLIGAAVAITTLTIFARQSSQKLRLSVLNSSAKSLLSSNSRAKALIANLESGQLINKKDSILLPEKLKIQTIDNLQQVINTSILEGHIGDIYNVSFSPDGQTIATASEDNTAKVWNLRNLHGEKPQTLRGHENRVWNARFSPNGKTIATASWDGKVKLWQRSDQQWKCITTLKGHNGWVFSVSFSPDGKTLASVGADKIIRLWNLENYTLIDKWNSGHQKNVVSVSFSPNGQMIGTASDDKTAKLWKLNGKELHPLKGHTNEVNGISFSLNGQMIATVSDDTTTKLWNLEGREIRTLKGRSGKIMSASFSPDSKIVATANFGQTVSLWQLDGQQKNPDLYEYPNWVWDVSFSPDGKFLASAGRDGKVRLWPINSGKQKAPVLENLLKEGCQALGEYSGKPDYGFVRKSGAMKECNKSMTENAQKNLSR